MLEKILSLKDSNNSVNEFCQAVRQGVPSAIFGVNDAFKNYLVGTLPDKVLLVVKDNITAWLSSELITDFSGKKTVIIPPKDEVLLTSKAYSKERQYARIKALSQIKEAKVIIATPEALMQPCPKTIERLNVWLNGNLERDLVVKKLAEMGYVRVDSVESAGTFSVRGDIVDVFPIGEETPFRIDFFDDTVEDIKKFDPETRKGLGRVKDVEILSAVEFTFTETEKKNLLSRMRDDLKRANREQSVRLSVLKSDAENAVENNSFDSLSVYSTLSSISARVFDLLDQDTVVVVDECKRVYEMAELIEKEFTERYKSLLESGEVFSFQQENLIGLERLSTELKKFRITAVQALSTGVRLFNPLKIINANVGGVVDYQLDFKEVFTDIENWLRTGYKVLVCTANLSRAERFSLELSGMGIASSINTKSEFKGVCISSEKLARGFIFHEEKIVVIGSGNLYAKPAVQKKLTSKKQVFFSAPETGDYCAHEVHGVGRVLGVKKISSTEGTKDYVAVEYAGGDILYIPVEQMDILTRYLGGDKKPRLSKIGGKDFERIKNSVKESIKKMSFDLKRLYQEREQNNGYKFTNDTELQHVFENAFPFEDTPDQAVANSDIENDMTSGKVMDRLVCGDVGFGKTEVAFRAVFRAVANGKQAVMLAPTTILTEQHYNTAVERFKDFGIKIACLNRFKTPKQQKAILDGLKNGDVEFVIGTHRLLSKDVEFKDLGLLVLDEEQRFGVEHKEKIKLLKKNVDAITLTATPIPRTLHMSLSGIRSISTINTPPKKRLPVQTYVTEQTDTLIKDAVSKEINRGGQVFMLYNRVESINYFAERVKSIVPGVRITVAHGQMEERTLEKNILEFYRGESDVLISTTIIENGIDLPKANTLIVIDADRLGLSTLYQLKGRVGRSDRLAYAYFTFQRDKVLTDTAFERLNAIIEFTEMGSGIKIAMRDLEIRGAGNILGAEQHGHMDKIGYELYSKLLKEELTGQCEVAPELDVRVTAFIPDDYIISNTKRMEAYKEIAEISSLEEEKEFIDTMNEVYGSVPREMVSLINIATSKMLATKLGVSKIMVTKGLVSLSFDDFKKLSNPKLHNAISEFGDRAWLNMAERPMIEFSRDGDNAQMLETIREFLLVATDKK